MKKIGEKMTAEIESTEQEDQKIQVKVQGSSETIYGLGLIGAWVYYIGRAVTPQEKVRGFFKGLFWPAFLVYEMLKFFNQE
jgi:hypothetical protein